MTENSLSSKISKENFLRIQEHLSLSDERNVYYILVTCLWEACPGKNGEKTDSFSLQICIEPVHVKTNNLGSDQV